MMTRKALVIGNGESRAWFNPSQQTIEDEDVTTYGCNAIYRDGNVDILVSVDYAMQQEIYDSDYAGLCYFSNWCPIPATIADMMFVGYDIPEDFIHYSKDKTEECVVSGKDPATIQEGIAAVLRAKPNIDLPDLKTKLEMDVGVWITYVKPEDKVESIDYPVGWSAGNTALHLACQHKAEKIYILGFDLSSYGSSINNIYKGTKNYLPADSKGFNSVNWENQLETVIKEFPNIEFVVVGKHITNEELCKELKIL